MECRMDGRVAAITGGSMGLGRAMAETFAKSGAKVALLARRPEPLAEAKAAIIAAGGTAEAYSCDVSKQADIEKTHAAILRDLGPVDILVNNAGASAAKSFESITDEEWSFDLELKLFSAIRLTRLVLPGMKQRRWGRIINVLNTYAKAAGPNSAPTSVSRAAGMALTKVLAGECAPHNVLVNGLLVGLIESDQWQRRFKAQGGNRTYETFLEEFAKERKLPMGRLGTAQEFANIACFLASDAGSYINGTATNVDGGMSPVV